MNSDYASAVKKSYLFSSVSDEAISRFAENSKLVSFENDQAVYDVGATPASVYFVLEGSVKIEIPMPDGDILFMGVMPSTTLFGEHEALCNTYSVARISAVGDCKILVIPKNNFSRLFKSEPGFSQALAQQLAMSMRMMCLATAHHFNSSAEKKLASLLVHLADRIGEDRNGSIRMSLRLSQDELAHMMSSTRQTVNKYLQTWRKNGWVEVDHGVIEICDLSALKSMTSEELLKEFSVLDDLKALNKFVD